jgi:hypothetical protein
MIQAVYTSEVSVSFYQTTRLKIPEEGHLLILYFQYELSNEW